MKVSATINKPFYFKDNTKISANISAFILIAGIISGTFIYIISRNNIANELFEYFISFSMYFSNKNNIEILSGLIMQNITYYIFMLVFATCVFGTSAVFFISFVKAMGLGMLTTHIYNEFALKGIEYCLLVFFPGKLLLIFAMVLLTQNCYLTSLDINKKVRYNNDRVVELRKFGLRALLILIIILISSLVDFLTVTSFSSLFDFS